MEHALALTPGDPAGIGPEIVAKALATGLAGKPVVYGDRRIMTRAAAVAGVQLPHDLAYREVPWEHPDLPAFGELDPRAGRHALACVEAAATDALAGQIAGLVTALINKQAILPFRPHFIGHTEYLAELAGVTDFGMLLVVDEFRVLHVTTHVSVREAIALLDVPSILATIRLGARHMPELGLSGGAIAVMGLNPHAGEGGRFGREELDIIGPACDQARAEGLNVHGPLPPDTVFYRVRQGEFALVIAMLHDQGHIPLKLWGMDRGINTTIGLPFVRTSVDHGTAFDLAGSGKASAGSLHHAWDLARHLASVR